MNERKEDWCDELHKLVVCATLCRVALARPLWDRTVIVWTRRPDQEQSAVACSWMYTYIAWLIWGRSRTTASLIHEIQ
jgi:hypothetical protein